MRINLRFRYSSCVIALGLLLLGAFLPSRARAESADFVVQWQDASARFPWLSDVSVRVFSGKGSVASQRLPTPPTPGEFPHGLSVTLTTDESNTEPVWLQLKLGAGYGFTFSDQMLKRQPYIWVKDMGIYISQRGDWRETVPQRAAAAKKIEQSFSTPYVSACEQYFRWTGFTEHEPDDIHRKFWEFIETKQSWPLAARAIDQIARMPEVDADYFTARIPDIKFSRMFLGWPEHNDQFTLYETGRIAVSSQSVGGNVVRQPDLAWHPRAFAYTLQFGVGASPAVRFREPGDDSVRQRLEDGHRLIVTTEWTDAGAKIEQTTLACPLDGTEVRTGLEPLLAWTQLRVTNPQAEARDVYVGAQFTDYDYVTFMIKNPLPNLDQLTWRKGGFYLLGQLVAVTDPALEFEESPTLNGKEFRARVHLEPNSARTFSIANFYRLNSPERVGDVQALGYDQAHSRMRTFWDGIERRGASITVPEPLFNHLYRTFLPRILITAHLDPKGMAVLHTSPIVYSRVWHHLAALGLAGDLARRGQFELVKRYLEPFFLWQDIPAPDSPAIKDWSGFFGAPPEQCPRVWISYQGRILWAAARYFQLSGDRAWLDEKMPALLKGMRWVKNARNQNRQLAPDGSRPLNFGWIPPGRTGDGASGTSIFTDSNIWLGLETVSQALEEIRHPEAGAWRAETDEYRQCIQDGQRRAMAERPLLRLNDDTWTPYFPSFFESKGIETKVKYFDVVDGAWAMGVFDTEIFPPGSPEMGWLVNQFEDNFAILNPSLTDEPFTVNGMGEYLEKDQIANFLYSFYSQSTTSMARETLTNFEHRSWGQKRMFEVAPWAAGIWTANYAAMLCRKVGNELWLLQATPRRWMRDGEAINVEKLQTEFGPVSFSVQSALGKGTITANLDLPSRHLPEKTRLRLRAPDGKRIQSVAIDGRAWTDFDPAGEWITLPKKSGQTKVEARY